MPVELPSGDFSGWLVAMTAAVGDSLSILQTFLPTPQGAAIKFSCRSRIRGGFLPFNPLADHVKGSSFRSN